MSGKCGNDCTRQAVYRTELELRYCRQGAAFFQLGQFNTDVKLDFRGMDTCLAYSYGQGQDNPEDKLHKLPQKPRQPAQGEPGS